MSQEKLEYRAIPVVQEGLETGAKMRTSDNPRVRQAAEWFNFDEGTKLQLTIEITDRELAHLFLLDAFGGDTYPLPGMKIQAVGMPGQYDKGVLRDWLRDRLTELEAS